MKNGATYTGENTREISFPLGGLGSGCVGLAGNGQLIDLEIFNRPNKCTHMGLSHFAVKVEDENGVIDARVCQSPFTGSRTGPASQTMFHGFGFGPERASMMGMPHFEDGAFTGRFPVAELELKDKRFPGELTLEAFSPFIPLNEDDSSLPAAFFTFKLRNTSEKPLTYTLAFTLCNRLTLYAGRTTTWTMDGARGLTMTAPERENDSLAIAADGEGSLQQYWYRGDWFDGPDIFWQDFTAYGPLKNRVYEDGNAQNGTPAKDDDLGTLASTVKLMPGEMRELHFVLSWYIPVVENFWNPCTDGPNTWKTWYATRYTSAEDVARYAMSNFARLREDTLRFRDALFASTLPAEALEAASANLAVLKSPTCLRLEDGSFYGFEGCHQKEGSCEGTCTHVWSYTYALPFLFPRLERSMRENEYKYSMLPSGAMGFRLQLPLGRAPSTFRPCADGQFGTVMRVWREFTLCGDKEWLRALWPELKRSVEYAWSPENYDRWDADKDGIMEGRQHHTLDMELFGPNSWLTGMYLGGLEAAARMAEIMDEPETAAEYRRIAASGREKLNNDLWNGHWFIQTIDMKDREQLKAYTVGNSMVGAGAADSYWNSERGEVKYQIGQGCALDQMLGQWHADLLDLGKIFDDEKVSEALASIMKYNFMPRAADRMNPCRLYCIGEEAGLQICVWPEGVQKPSIGVPYNQECMNGYEYAGALLMILRGMEKEGLTCVKAIRDRYDGAVRNPWNEFECGSNYARSMASFALVPIYSGYHANLYEGSLRFAPLHPENFRSVWFTDKAWGTVEYCEDKVTLRVISGALTLKTLSLPRCGLKPISLTADGKDVSFTTDGQTLSAEGFTFDRELTVTYAKA